MSESVIDWTNDEAVAKAALMGAYLTHSKEGFLIRNAGSSGDHLRWLPLCEPQSTVEMAWRIVRTSNPTVQAFERLHNPSLRTGEAQSLMCVICHTTLVRNGSGELFHAHLIPPGCLPHKPILRTGEAQPEPTWVPVYVDRAICDLIADDGHAREIARVNWMWDDEHPTAKNDLHKWQNEAIRQRVELIALQEQIAYEATPTHVAPQSSQPDESKAVDLCATLDALYDAEKALRNKADNLRLDRYVGEADGLDKSVGLMDALYHALPHLLEANRLLTERDATIAELRASNLYSRTRILELKYHLSELEQRSK